MLIELVNKYGTKQWSVVASHLNVSGAAGFLRRELCSSTVNA
jgi:hypothetical protein